MRTSTGVSFAVWAPNAQAVRVIGDFNHWVGRGHAMRAMGSTGVWELFLPEVAAGARYNFEILGKDGGALVVHSQIAPLLDDRGRVNHWLSIHRNALPHQGR